MSVSSLSRQISQLKSERNKLESRKSSVNKIIKQIGKDPADDVDDIKKCANSTADALSKGVSGSSRVKSVAEKSRAKAKSGCSLDHWEEKDKLNQEVQRIGNRIDEIDREIKRLEAQLRAEQEAERAAALNAIKNALF